MIYRTSIGLDVHARSISAAAFVPETGEVEERSFGYDAEAVAKWAAGLPQPARAVYESGPTGFDLKRSLDGLGLPTCVGAASKMLKPSGDRVKTDKSESAPFPLTHGVPFRHDAVNGERGHRMGHPSPKYSAEFKQQAVRLYRERGGTYAEIARELGVDAGSISDWVKKADTAQASPEDNPFKVAEENRRLRREVERLRRENEVLLKASAFFASRQL